MASHISLQLPRLFCHSKPTRSDNRQNTKTKALQRSSFFTKDQLNYDLSKSSVFLTLLFKRYITSRWSSSFQLSCFFCSAHSTKMNVEKIPPVAKTDPREVKFSRVNCLLWVLHESAKCFSHDVESLELTGSGPELAMAWIGKDIHEWHKRIAYFVAIYALLKTAIGVEVLLSHDRHSNNPSPVKEMLTPKINLVREYIESQLHMRHSELVEWFRVVESPRIVGFFTPLLKKWSMEYAGSGVAGMVVTITCCTAVGKLGLGRLTCPHFTLSTQDVMVELMDQAHSIVPVEKLHHLATEAGFELDFLFHFGNKILPSKTNEELEFWISLAQKKLSRAFCRENLKSGGRSFQDKVQANTLATLGIFAYLGKRTRLFLSKVGIKDLDEPVKNFVSYLECGSLFIYPEFSSMSVYQSFMELVTDEIGWLNFYASSSCTSNQERRRSKQHVLQAEKEIVLHAVFTTCYDVFSGFAHFNRSSQQPLDADLKALLHQSQILLRFCLDYHWAAYDKSRKVACSSGTETVNSTDGKSAAKSNSYHQGLVRMYSIKLASASSDIWMGTQLLFADILISVDLLLKQFRGHKVSRRERKNLKRTFHDIANLIPVTILMLLPVSAVGHAAMLAAINKYMPCMIPSPYSSDRLDVMKQLLRTKKMEPWAWNNLEDTLSNS